MKRYDRAQTSGRRSSFSRWIRSAAIPVALIIVAAACGDSGSSSTPAGTSGTGTGTGTTVPATTAPPQTGGTLNFAAYSQIASLDPVVALGNGTSVPSRWLRSTTR